MTASKGIDRTHSLGFEAECAELVYTGRCMLKHMQLGP